MSDFIVRAASKVDAAAAEGAQMGPRFGRLDLSSQLAVLAVESLAIDFASERRERIGICLAAGAGSLATDVEYWQSKDNPGGPSPTLFAYTLPSAAIGEIAIRYQLTGPNLCFVGGSAWLEEACDLLHRGEAESCVCVASSVITPAAAALLETRPTAWACALFVSTSGAGYRLVREIDRDIESVCQLVLDSNKLL